MSQYATHHSPAVQARNMSLPFTLNSFSLTHYRVALTELGDHARGTKSQLWLRLIEWPDRAAVLHALMPSRY